LKSYGGLVPKFKKVGHVTLASGQWPRPLWVIHQQQQQQYLFAIAGENIVKKLLIQAVKV